jgi:hypothetical protein
VGGAHYDACRPTVANVSDNVSLCHYDSTTLAVASVHWSAMKAFMTVHRGLHCQLGMAFSMAF